MSSDNGFLSQDEIDALLNGGGSSEPPKEPSEPSSGGSTDNKISESKEKPKVEHASISDIEIDLLGEIGNISMGSASTALSTILGQPVNITTPTVEVTTLNEMRDSFDIPNIALEVKYISGIIGGNLLVMKMTDAAVIADLMMGKDGKGVEEKKELSELEISAVSEAMNQMIGSAATSMATMFAREVNISPPTSKIWEDITSPLAEGISEYEDIIKVSFRMTIGDLVDSTIMQVLPIATAKKIVSIMMGQEEPEVKQPGPKQQAAAPTQIQAQAPVNAPQPQVQPKPAEMYYEPAYTAPIQPVNVQQASFQPLQQMAVHEGPKNIDLILDVPLEISVVLGKAKLSIKDVLALGTGSLIELDKLAEEPVEIHVNGKKVAYGEVVVVDENFGVRIVNIVSSEDRVKSLKG
ncbi:flagellar motor switch protein FliN [Clostridium homopropionicum DSM 5847]|uniref:Flagellar motor switch protein FliN n=1 Tax=Clostridium homopropionicum DSM 5847 TaxID=1121318 RepID=A0A0L6ZDJ7_9CLOT|nr:flagellar motor switch phosphatase FliY [Clostridium homopropionicum]KOA21054.1 flagellar motor switch protein FliN [Clostridium homopropionicum DSM 5847]SFF98400.1 flagellar motor switch protein FliN/FliY [Clostridium homopropionicum]